MIPGRYGKVTFLVVRTEVICGADFSRVVTENTTVKCVRCSGELLINQDTAFLQKKSLDDMPYIRCPRCGFACALENYWPQTEAQRPRRRSGNGPVLQTFLL